MDQLEFANNVAQKLPNDWTVDELAPKKTDGRQMGLRRDDLLAVIIEVPTEESWMPDQALVHIPKSVDGIPDRPNQPVYTVDCSVAEVVKCITEHAPEYTGTFEYDENQP